MQTWLFFGTPDAEAAQIIRLLVQPVDRWPPLQRIGRGGRLLERLGVVKREHTNNDMLSSVDFEAR